MRHVRLRGFGDGGDVLVRLSGCDGDEWVVGLVVVATVLFGPFNILLDTPFDALLACAAACDNTSYTATECDQLA